jgi:hypothetical protein
LNRRLLQLPGRLWRRFEFERYHRWTRRRIRQRGWSSVAVWDDDEVQYWEYTIGFDESLGHPEIIVGGLPPNAADALFGPLFQAIKHGLVTPGEGVRWGLDGRDDCVFRDLHPSRRMLDWAALAMRRRDERGLRPLDLKALQLVLPDEAGILPWEPGHDPAQRIRTPELWRPAQVRGCGERRRVTGHGRPFSGRST